MSTSRVVSFGANGPMEELKPSHSDGARVDMDHTIARTGLAVVGAVVITGIGWAAFVENVHVQTPILAMISWLGLPLLQISSVIGRNHSDSAAFLSIGAGLCLWAALLFSALGPFVRRAKRG